MEGLFIQADLEKRSGCLLLFLFKTPVPLESRNPLSSKLKSKDKKGKVSLLKGTSSCSSSNTPRSDENGELFFSQARPWPWLWRSSSSSFSRKSRFDAIAAPEQPAPRSLISFPTLSMLPNLAVVSWEKCCEDDDEPAISAAITFPVGVVT